MKLELVLDEVDLPWSPGPEWTRRLSRILEATSAADCVLQVVITDDETLQEHNRDYRGLDRPTDVLSFSYLEGHEGHEESLLPEGADLHDYLDPPGFPGEVPVAGQILVSAQTVVDRGAVHTEDLDQEMAFMVLHGLLHVLGFDHADSAAASRMHEHERRLMLDLGYPPPRPEGPA